MIIVYILLACAAAYAVYYTLQFKKQSSAMVNYTPEQVVERRSDTNVVILDVRTDMERNRNQINGSIHIPLGDIEARAGELSPYKKKEIICYCQGGVRSVTAAAKLKELGFNASNMMGGIAEWNSKKLK